MPVGGGDDPLSGRGLRGPLPDQPDDLRDVTGPGDRHPEDVAGRQHQVVVRVDEHGHDHEPGVVEHDGVRALPGAGQAGFLPGPGDGRDLAVADGQRGHRVGIRVHGPHGGRSHEQVGGWSCAHPRLLHPVRPAFTPASLPVATRAGSAGQIIRAAAAVRVKARGAACGRRAKPLVPGR